MKGWTQERIGLKLRPMGSCMKMIGSLTGLILRDMGLIISLFRHMKILALRLALLFPFVPLPSADELSYVESADQTHTEDQAGQQEAVIHEAPDQKHGEHGHANANFRIICHLIRPKTFKPIPNKAPETNRMIFRL